MKQKSRDKHVIRQCASSEHDAENRCFYRTGYLGRMSICSCTGDGCNTAIKSVSTSVFKVTKKGNRKCIFSNCHFCYLGIRSCLAREIVQYYTMDKAPIKIYGNDSLSTRVAAFQKKADEHTHKQKQNPFSCSGNVSGMVHQKWDKSDPRYGTPPEGSKTDKRGRAAGAHIGNEVKFLCDMISQYGVPNEDDTVSISFGELFQIYTTISNKVVGILLRARKHGLVHFEGEMLYQGRDNNVMITLLKPVSEAFPSTAQKRKLEEQPMQNFPLEDY
ncbi:actin-binding Rho-activating protein [Trichonephila inaurata madagascariensis]|uniref:Actin-binding Rho-activating protein n=1 Tax=Trichonephila inaurata madagascariensis TaxID=2747483 RepID=A0A8X6WTJ4_9ARAC|nr:actin-binding Rho-activating protein [Trichonephila inaurata madagascariensis]